MKERFRKITGKFRYRDDDGNLVVIGPGEVVEIEPERIKEFMDTFMKLDPTPVPVPEPPKVGLHIVQRPGSEGVFDVLNADTGKNLNDAPLSLEEAQGLVK